MRNLKLAFRTLVRSPFVTGVAIISLALGIGANTAIFSLIQRVLFKSLPVPEPDRLVNLVATGPNPGSQTCNQAGDCDIIFNYPMFRDLEKSQTVLTGIAGHRMVGADLAFRGRTLSGEGASVSGSYFSVLQLRPALGRLLGPEDDRVIGGHPVVVLSHHYWANELGADPGVLDQPITVNGVPMTIVGVAPRGFDGTTLGSRPRIFFPLTMRSAVESWADPSNYTERRSYWVYLFGRLKPGVSRQQASERINAIYTPIIRDVEAPLQGGLPDQMMTEFKDKKIRIDRGNQGQSSLMAQTSTPLSLLLAVTGIVLLVACTNVANLLLARAAGRASEMAVRSSLGAARRQLITQLFTESALLAVIAGVASILVARWTLALILSFIPGDLTRTIDFGLDAPVLAFAALVSLGSCILFGIFPALHGTRPDLLAVTKSGGTRGSATRTATRFRNALVVGQIALSMALLSSAGLFIRSLSNISRVELGIRTDSVVSFAVSPGQIGYSGTASRTLFQRLETELAAIPGVTGVTTAIVPLLHGWSSGGDVDVAGFTATPETNVNGRLNWIGSNYFRTLGIPVLAGREFTVGDDAGTPKVVIVNEAFAKKFNLGSNPIGRRMRLGNALSPEMLTAKNRPDLEIVGLVKNAAYSEVKAKIPPVYYLAARQDTSLGRLVYYVRTGTSPTAVIRAIPPIVAKLEPNLPVSELKTLPQQISENVYLDRMIASLSAGFAVLATLLAAIGLYGVLAYTVTQRTREIGLRMALGADGGRVRGMVLRQVALMTSIGGAIGIAAAFGIGRSARSLLYGLAGHDLFAFGGAAAALTIVALSAGFIPALRASKVHPMEALRTE